MAGVAAVNDWVTPPEVDDWVTPPEPSWRGPAGEVDPRVPFAKPFAGADTAAIAKAGQFETALAPDEESAFQAWKQQYAPQDSGADYDLRGAFKAGLMPDPVTGHWPDTFKKPNHPTFSNQSQYASARPELAGTWDGDAYVPPQGRTALGWLDRTLEPVFPKEAMGHAASQYTGDIAKSWEQLKTDFMKQFPDPAIYKKAGFWEQQKQNFEGLLATGKSVVDAFNLAMSPVSAAFDVATTGIDAGAHAIVPGTTPGMLKDALDQSLIGIGPEGGLLGATAKVRTAAEAGRAAADFVNAAAPDESTLRLPAPKETAKAEENPTPRNGATAPPKDDWVTPPQDVSRGTEEPWLAPVDLEHGTEPTHPLEEPTPPLEEAPKKRVATIVEDAHKRDVAALTAEAVKNATTPGGEDFGAQAAAVAARQAKPKPSKPAKPSLSEKEGELLDQIRARGGINVTQGDHADIPEILKDYKNPPFKRRLLNPNGLLPDEMRKSLQSDGWFGGSPDRFGPTALAVGNYPGDDIRDLAGKISDSVNGAPVYHPEAAPPERAYDPVEHEHFLQSRADAAGTAPRFPNESLTDFDARITEREAIAHEPAAMTDLADEREAEQRATLDPWDDQYDPLDRAFKDENRRTAEVPGEPRASLEDAGKGEEAEPAAGGKAHDAGAGEEAEGDREDEVPSPGTRQSPVELHHEDDIAAARAEVEPNPSEAQKASGNYAKGHVRIHGMDVAIETPKGAARTGTGGDGKSWSNVNDLADYGYIKRMPMGADGEHVDTYIGHNPASDKAFVFDQYDPKTGAFDEHKTVLGVDTAAQAKAVYDAGFSDGSGPSRRKAMRQMSVPEFKDYLANGDLTKPAAKTGTDNEPKFQRSATNDDVSVSMRTMEDYFHQGREPKPIHVVLNARGEPIDWTTGNKARAEASGKFYPDDGHSIVRLTGMDIARAKGDVSAALARVASESAPATTEEPGAEDGSGRKLPQVVFPGMEKATPDEVDAYNEGTEQSRARILEDLRGRSADTAAKMKAAAQAAEIKRRQAQEFAQAKPLKKAKQEDMFAPKKPQGSLFQRIEPSKMSIWGKKNQAPDLFSGNPPPATAHQKKGPTEERVGLGADMKRMIDLFGPKMYGTNMPKVTMKELLQNSFDAVKSAYQRGDIKPGKGQIDIHLNTVDRGLAFTDNGAGMSPQTVKDAFLTIAGTNKDDLAEADRSGGFGVAKLAFIFGNDGLYLETVRDGVKTILETNSKELLEGKAQLRTEPTKDASGTVVRVRFPEEVKDSSGEMVPLHIGWGPGSFPVLEKPLLGDVGVSFTVNSERPETLNLGRNQPMKDFPKVSTVHFPWGDADVYLQPVKPNDYPKHEVLSSGLHQFAEQISKPGEWSNLPYNIVIDVRPSVEASAINYPFNNQRENWSPKVKDDVEQLRAFLKRKYSAEQARKIGGTFARMQAMSDDGSLTDLNLEQHIPEGKDFQIESEITIKNGATYIGGGKATDQTALSKEDELNVKAFKFPEKAVPSSAPYFHNNLNRDVVNEAKVLFHVAPAESRAFFGGLGTVFTEFRDALAHVPGYGEWGEPAHPVGISLDKTYHGVHISVPYKGMFLNPLSVQVSRASAIARSYVHTLLHEAVHTVATGHDEGFTTALSKLDGAFEETHPGLKAQLERKIVDLIEDHREAFEAMRKVFNDNDTRNLSEAGQGQTSQVREQGRAAGVPGRASGPREVERLAERVHSADRGRSEEGDGRRAVQGSDENSSLISHQRIKRPTAHGPVPPYTPRSNAAPGQGGLGGIGKPPPPNVPPPPAGGGQGGLSLPSVAEPVGKKLTDWEDDLHRIKQNNEADRLKALQYLQGLPAELRDTGLQERFYLHKEEGTPLTAAEQKLYDKYVAPIMKQAKDTYDRIRKEGYPASDEGYVHRIVKGKGSMYDEPKGALGDNPIFGPGNRSLSKKAPSLHGRSVFMGQGDKGTLELVSGQKYKPDDTYENAATGEKFTVRQATTREIEARTPLEYHKNALVNSLDNLTRLRRAERNIQFLEHLKKDPTFLENALPQTSDKIVPPDWRTTDLPQLAGWRMNPRLANLFSDFYGQRGKGGAIGDVLGKVNRAVVSSIFVNPISAFFGHGLNVATHWYTGRGWDNFLPQTWGKSAVNGMRAIRDVATLSPRYIQMMREGTALQYAPIFTADFHKAMIDMMQGEMKKAPADWADIAKRAGTTPAVVYNWLSKISRKGLWSLSDVLALQRIYDLQGKGLKTREAIKQTEREIPNYRIPTEAWEGTGGRAFSELIQNQNVLVFGRYRYAMLRAYADTIKQGFSRGSSTKDRVNAAGQLLAMGVLLGLLYPLADQALQAVTGNKDARFRRSGPATLPDNISRISTGEKDFTDALSGLFALAPGTQAIGELATNRQLWNGEHVYNPEGSVPEIAKELGYYGATQFSPIDEASQIARKTKTPAEIAEGWTGAKVPRPGALARTKHFKEIEGKRDSTRWRKLEGRLKQGIESILP